MPRINRFTVLLLRPEPAVYVADVDTLAEILRAVDQGKAEKLELTDEQAEFVGSGKAAASAARLETMIRDGEFGESLGDLTGVDLRGLCSFSVRLLALLSDVKPGEPNPLRCDLV